MPEPVHSTVTVATASYTTRLAPGVESPYARWLRERGRYHVGAAVARRAGAPLHSYHLCGPLACQERKGCAARALQGKLKRRGFFASQYQCHVTTDADHGLVMALTRGENP